MKRKDAEYLVWSATQDFKIVVAKLYFEDQTDDQSRLYPLFGSDRGIRMDDRGKKLWEAIRVVFGLTAARGGYFKGSVFKIDDDLNAVEYRVRNLKKLSLRSVEKLEQIHKKFEQEGANPIKIECVVDRPGRVKDVWLAKKHAQEPERPGPVVEDAGVLPVTLSPKQKTSIMDLFVVVRSAAAVSLKSGLPAFLKGVKKITGVDFAFVRGSGNDLETEYSKAMETFGDDDPEKFQGLFAAIEKMMTQYKQKNRKPDGLGSAGAGS